MTRTLFFGRRRAFCLRSSAWLRFRALGLLGRRLTIRPRPSLRWRGLSAPNYLAHHHHHHAYAVVEQHPRGGSMRDQHADVVSPSAESEAYRADETTDAPG